MTKKILIGKINSVFGIKGAVKIISFCEEPLQIESYSIFDENDNPVKLKISNKNKAIVGKDGGGNAILIASIEGVKDRTTAENLRGQELFMNREELNDTDSDEFYYIDLIGLDVIENESSDKIGKVTNVQDFGAGGMIEIDFNDKFRKTLPDKSLNKTENFPFKDDFFPEIDIKSNFIKLKVPEILKDIERTAKTSEE